MQLPVKFNIDSTTYNVLVRENIGRLRLGVCYPDLQILKIATHPYGTRRADYGARGINETFWHETTHAILFEMGDPRWNDEVFVTGFSRRLAQVIETAEFK